MTTGLLLGLREQGFVFSERAPCRTGAFELTPDPLLGRHRSVDNEWTRNRDRVPKRSAMAGRPTVSSIDKSDPPQGAKAEPPPMGSVIAGTQHGDLVTDHTAALRRNEVDPKQIVRLPGNLSVVRRRDTCMCGREHRANHDDAAKELDSRMPHPSAFRMCNNSEKSIKMHLCHRHLAAAD